MAWEATCLLSPILLMLLTSGSWSQDTELHQTVEGKTTFVSCRYHPSKLFNVKVWCQETPEKNCKLLVSSLDTDAQQSKFSLRDYPDSHFFTVTMTALTVRDSGPYFCGIAENRRTIIILRSIRLVVSKAPTPRTASWRTTTLALATSPDTGSPPDNWMWKVILAGVAVAMLLLLGLVVLVILNFQNARRRAQKVENECHHIYEDFPGQQVETTAFSQQTLSNEDTETMCYASLVHLNHVSPQDSISSNTQPYPKPSPDPLLSVEYASISRNRLQTSKAP
ncbi:natural cytotoxicity triggering receptor 2-like [Onychomys torridus]|uniref:natural cytotoxicity triggering receptor 2-like n=1 Tax=Onychomys torridus TaxID=38674 RepID=UPI00167FD322|nr:natural cytotoxicity triggering receptor 2-like [Onychomys torridus]